jgi:hypothetical protein
MGDRFKQMQQSMNGKTGQDYQNEALKDWAARQNDRLNEEPGIWNSMIRWPLDKWTDFKTDKALQFADEAVNQKRMQSLKEMEAMMQDRAISEQEAKSDSYNHWKDMLRGQGIK